MKVQLLAASLLFASRAEATPIASFAVQLYNGPVASLALDYGTGQASIAVPISGFDVELMAPFDPDLVSMPGMPAFLSASAGPPSTQPSEVTVLGFDATLDFTGLWATLSTYWRFNGFGPPSQQSIYRTPIQSITEVVPEPGILWFISLSIIATLVNGPPSVRIR